MSSLAPQPGVVLVHGAYADGSSWSEVIERLQRAGLAAAAVQNPLTSLADDVAHTRRILALRCWPRAPESARSRPRRRRPRTGGSPSLPRRARRTYDRIMASSP